jgi:carbon-monoxide dehydrogenase medium subunit
MTGVTGSRTVPLGDFLVDAYTTLLGSDEIVTAISITVPRRPCGGAYAKFEKRAGDFAVASAGVQVETDDGGVLRRVAVSLGAVGAVPIRARAAEDVLLGTAVPSAAVAEAERLVWAAAEPFEDTRGSVEYKRHLAGVLFRRALAAAVDRARGKEVISLHL